MRSIPALAILLLVACHGGKAGSPVEAAAKPDRITERALPDEGLVVQEIDLDGDGRADVFNYYRERAEASRLRVKKEVDLDLDGTIDVISEFDEDGNLQRELMDSDFDGSLDWTDHYENGQRVMAEMDTDFNGLPDVYFYYTVAEGQRPRIDRKERDTNGDGLIDFWERFDAEGNVIRTGRDIDGDGKMDERDE